MAKRRSTIRSSFAPASRRPQSPDGTRVSNHLLAALPVEEYTRLIPTLDVVPLILKKVMHKPGERVEQVYFPGGGFCSELAVLSDGTMVEVATVGREGVVGVAAVLDGGRVPSITMVQAATDTCYRMTASAFRAEMDRRAVFYELVMRYAQAHLGIIMQSTACNAVHVVEQRLARWLLMAHDRVEKDQFPLTQEFVAMMLGVARPTVSVVAGTLQKAGLITYRHGQVTIVDREKLEGASCECYRTATELLRDVTAISRRSQE